jgi:adenine phosphoribosyltransferase
MLEALIRDVPDWPKPGITFRDITPVLQDPRSFRVLIDLFVYRYMRQRLDLVAGVDARGFILGSVLAYELNLGFVPVRKKGKLPFSVIGEDYQLEYGTDRIEIHTDAIRPGDQVLLVDDLIATGGTAMAGINLLERAGAKVIGCSFVIDLPELGGAEKLRQRGMKVSSLVAFEGH